MRVFHMRAMGFTPGTIVVNRKNIQVSFCATVSGSGDPSYPYSLQCDPSPHSLH